MKLFKKVAIVGTGLIGGSLGMVIKRNHLADQVVGVSRHKRNIVLAKKMGAIDSGSQSLEIIRGADLLILATPIDTIISQAPRISKLVKAGCIVTDVGSTKEKIVSSLTRVFPRFVGTHPMAGSEKRSIINANPNLFKGSLCILTKTNKTDQLAFVKIMGLWKRLGARLLILSPKEHDKALGFVSHLPHLIAFSLINSIPDKNLKFASGGLKDTTRIAASDSEIWSEIFFSNRKNILNDISLFEKQVSRIKSALQKSNKKPLKSILKQAKTKRDNLE